MEFLQVLNFKEFPTFNNTKFFFFFTIKFSRLNYIANEINKCCTEFPQCTQIVFPSMCMSFEYSLEFIFSIQFVHF